MKVSKEYIMALSALIAVLGGVGAGYQFYYRERVAQYQKNIQDEKKYEETLIALETEFEGCKPVELIKAVNGEVNPLVEELRRRATMFQVSDLREVQPVPDGKMPGFYYREEFDRLYKEFQAEALKTYPMCAYPNVTFGAPRPDELTGIDVTKADVQMSLRKIVFGLSMMRLLMQSKAASVTDVQLWTPRMSQDKLFSEYTVGFWFWMAPKDLVAFLDKLRVGEVYGQQRFVTINALSVQNQYLRWPMEPPLEVQMVATFVQANVDENAEMEEGEELVTASGGGGGGGKSVDAQQALALFKSRKGSTGEGEGMGSRRMRNAPTTKWGKFVRWLDIYFWPFN